jgi:plastocyanin
VRLLGLPGGAARRAVGGVAGLLALACALAACSSGGTAAQTSSSPGSTSTGSTGSPTTTTLLTVPIPTLPGTVQVADGRQYLVVGGKRLLLPTEKGARPIDPTVDAGQNIMITTKGFWPATLLASPGLPITFTNVTDVPQTVTFEYSTIRSPVIPPTGGTWSWTSKTLISYRYHNAHGMSAVLIVNPQNP